MTTDEIQYAARMWANGHDTDRISRRLGRPEPWVMQFIDRIKTSGRAQLLERAARREFRLTRGRT